MEIQGKFNNKSIIIAEAGVNHNGNLKIAKKLIDCAVDSGANYVKFQTFKAENLVSQNAKKAKYQIQNLNNNDEYQFNMLKSLELSHNDHIKLIEHCNKKKISFLSTAFDNESLEYLYDLGLGLFKIPSGEITNYPYLKKISSFGKPIILSTGMSDLKDIKNALSVLYNNGIKKTQICVLHCNTDYPTKFIDVNLLAMLSIKKKLNISNIGYSDHTLGIEVPIAAVSLGANVIEKHFTLDRSMTGPDHKASLEPDELKNMVKSIRNIEIALSGDGIKKVSDSELENMNVVRKSIYLNQNVKKGDLIIQDHFISLRPGDGISPMEIPNIIGKTFKYDLTINTKLKKEHFG